MPRSFKIIFITVYTGCFLSFFTFGVRPTNNRGLLLLPFGFLFFCICIWSLITVFAKWKAMRFWAATPLIACLLMMPADRWGGRLVRSELFEWRFPRYNALVQKIESGAIPVATESQMIPATNYDASLAHYGVWAQRGTNGIFMIEFLYGIAGPPPYHQAYVYVSSGPIEPVSYLEKRWPSVTHIKDNWFEVVN